MSIEMHPIGVIHSPFTATEGMPIQPTAAGSAAGTVEIRADLAEGLRDLDGFSHVVLVYHLHRAGPVRLTVVPFLDDAPRGVFATRAPVRPNGIGLSIVRLDRVEGTILHVTGLDVLDGTPLLDIKPYVPSFDARERVRTGWLAEAQHRVRSAESDARFDGG